MMKEASSLGGLLFQRHRTSGKQEGIGGGEGIVGSRSRSVCEVTLIMTGSTYAITFFTKTAMLMGTG